MAQRNSKRYSLEVDSARGSGADASALFEDALSKMDGVIGIDLSEVTTFGHDATSVGSRIIALCRQVHAHVVAAQQASGGTLDPDPRLEIPLETRDFIINWLNEDPRGSPFTDTLQRDKDTLLHQVQTLERKLEAAKSENESLKNSMADMQSKDYYGGRIRSSSTSNVPSVIKDNKPDPKIYRTGSGSLQRNASGSEIKRQRSLRDSFRKAFKKKSKNSKDLESDCDDLLKNLNPRAKHFNSLVGADLADWIASIGLEMYGDLISQLVGTGERLASIADNREDLVRLGVINILHCKKIKLAVDDAIAHSPSPLSQLDHSWVAEWLTDIGLSQYSQAFLDARIDALMLNSITLDDLTYLKIEHPFHILSIKRAIQAFRISGYNRNYLKTRIDKGGYKLMHWSVYHIMDWLKDIEMDDYADDLQGTGISGPVMMLESGFTHESLAKVVGISGTKGLLMAHLAEKFLVLVGPIFAQRKVDMMNQKHFVPLDPVTQPTKNKGRSKHKKSKQATDEQYLCPFTDMPVVVKPVTIRRASNGNISPPTTEHPHSHTFAQGSVGRSSAGGSIGRGGGRSSGGYGTGSLDRNVAMFSGSGRSNGSFKKKSSTLDVTWRTSTASNEGHRLSQVSPSPQDIAVSTAAATPTVSTAPPTTSASHLVSHAPHHQTAPSTSVPQPPSVPQVPPVSAAPSVPQAPPMPSVPKAPSVPQAPTVSSVPQPVPAPVAPVIIPQAPVYDTASVIPLTANGKPPPLYTEPSHPNGAINTHVYATLVPPTQVPPMSNNPPSCGVPPPPPPPPMPNMVY